MNHPPFAHSEDKETDDKKTNIKKKKTKKNGTTFKVGQSVIWTKSGRKLPKGKVGVITHIYKSEQKASVNVLTARKLSVEYLKVVPNDGLTTAQAAKARKQYNLGQFYRQGTGGVTQSDKRAIEFFTLAAEQGLAEAQYALGYMYAEGEIVEQSHSKAREWWTKAAAQGHKNAITALKIMDENEGIKTTSSHKQSEDDDDDKKTTFKVGQSVMWTKKGTVGVITRISKSGKKASVKLLSSWKLPFKYLDVVPNDGLTTAQAAKAGKQPHKQSEDDSDSDSDSDDDDDDDDDDDNAPIWGLTAAEIKAAKAAKAVKAGWFNHAKAVNDHAKAVNAALVAKAVKVNAALVAKAVKAANDAGFSVGTWVNEDYLMHDRASREGRRQHGGAILRYIKGIEWKITSIDYDAVVITKLNGRTQKYTLQQLETFVTDAKRLKATAKAKEQKIKKYYELEKRKKRRQQLQWEQYTRPV